MRTGPRKAVLPPDFIGRFVALFPPTERGYESINRRVQNGLVDDIAAFLYGQRKKLSASDVLVHLKDGMLAESFVEELKRQCEIDDLYGDITNLIRSLPF